jgi:hypothetical protein
MNRPRGGTFARAVVRGGRCACSAALAASCASDDATGPVGGSVRVTASTTGADLDRDGYMVLVDGRVRARLAVNGTARVDGLEPGTHVVTVGDVASNCAIRGDSARSVAVATVGEVVDVPFAGDCVPVGRIHVTVVTTGADPDQNGYRVTVDPGGLWDVHPNTVRFVAADDTTTYALREAGRRQLWLAGVAANCGDAGLSPRWADVAHGTVVRITFHVACAPVTRIAYVEMLPGDNTEIWAVNSNGTGATRLTFHFARDDDPAWSPDGARIAFTSTRDGGRAIYLMNADGSHPVRLTNPAAASYGPAWSPDGSRIAFVSERDGNAELYVMNADGTREVRLTNDAGRDTDPTWSPDGGRIAFASGRAGALQVHVVNTDGTGVTRLTNSNADERHPAWSPDGRRLAFTRRRCGTGESTVCYQAIFVMGTHPTEPPAKVGLGEAPAWSGDGGKIAVTGFTCDYYYYTGPPCDVAGIGIVSPLESGDLPGPRSIWDYGLTRGTHSNPSWRW